MLAAVMNRKTKKQIEKEIQSSLTDVIEGMKEAVREGGSEYGNDMLGLMLAAVDQEKDPERKKVQFGVEALTEEFKRFFLAGREATASLLTWALMFLGTHTVWQDRARHEVMELCKDGCPPTIETISKMKVVSGQFDCTSSSSMFNLSPIAFQF